MKLLVTGATGLIGKRLVESVAAPVVLSRDPQRARRGLGEVEAFPWAPESGPPPAEAFQGVDAVVHLAGDPVAEGRWSEEKKRRIRDSRVTGTRNMVLALSRLANPPRVLVSASAVGYYGDRGDEELTEASSPGKDFLADVCVAWEREAMAAGKFGVRVVCLRTGIVLAAQGGALPRMLAPMLWGLGGQLGNGRQWMPWIHIDDVAGIILHASGEEGVRGPVNAVSPHPAMNGEFTRTLAHAVRRPAVFRVPRAALRFAFGEMSAALLASQRALPAAAQKNGYAFKYADLNGALNAALAS